MDKEKIDFKELTDFVNDPDHEKRGEFYDFLMECLSKGMVGIEREKIKEAREEIKELQNALQKEIKAIQKRIEILRNDQDLGRLESTVKDYKLNLGGIPKREVKQLMARLAYILDKIVDEHSEFREAD